MGVACSRAADGTKASVSRGGCSKHKRYSNGISAWGHRRNAVVTSSNHVPCAPPPPKACPPAAAVGVGPTDLGTPAQTMAHQCRLMGTGWLALSAEYVHLCCLPPAATCLPTLYGPTQVHTPHLAVEQHHHHLHGHGAHMRRLAGLLARGQLAHQHACVGSGTSASGSTEQVTERKGRKNLKARRWAARVPLCPPPPGCNSSAGAAVRAGSLPCVPSSCARVDVKGAASMAALRAGRYTSGTITCRETRQGLYTVNHVGQEQRSEADPAVGPRSAADS